MSGPYLVTAAAQRPVDPASGRCFYCERAIGQAHADDCVLVKKTVKVRAILEYEIDVPASWGADLVESHRNEGSWCASNIVAELAALDSKDKCLCGAVRFVYLADTAPPRLDEG